MFNQYEPNIKATIKLLKLLKVKVTNTTVNETLQNHPDWPSLLCVSDSLNKWNIPNGAGKINIDNIDELPTPFIAHTNNREFPLAIVTEVSVTSIKQISNEYKKEEILNKEDFLKTWGGVYLFAEPNGQSGEKNYLTNKNKELLNFLIPVGAFSLLIILSSYAMVKSLAGINYNQTNLSTAIFFQYFISFAGLFITSLLLWYEIDKNNPLLQKVCTGITKGNCNAILTGKQAKVFNWLSWSEVGFFYFSGAFLTLLFSGSHLVSSFALIGLFNILSIPYTAFSIYYQWKIAKQWCVLCLIVQLLLILGGINIIVNSNFLSLIHFPDNFALLNIIFYLLPILLWYSIKPIIQNIQISKNTKRGYLRLKFNVEIFDTLLKKQKQIINSPESIGIDLGNPSAKNLLIKVCNPYCGPCSDAHPKIEKLLEGNTNLKVKIIFTAQNSIEDLSFKPVNHLLAIAEKATVDIYIRNALNDWYLSKEKNYEEFAVKYKMNGELYMQGEKIDEMSKWCQLMEVHSTPTYFINGYQIPNPYMVEDLQYFLLE